MHEIDYGRMSDEQRAKWSFAESLGNVLYEATRGLVFEADYRAYTCGHEAVVLFVDGTEPNYDFREVPVNVTGDSLWAIAKDVMKAVAEIYE